MLLRLAVGDEEVSEEATECWVVASPSDADEIYKRFGFQSLGVGEETPFESLGLACSQKKILFAGPGKTMN